MQGPPDAQDLPDTAGPPDALGWVAAVIAARGAVCEQLGTGSATLAEVMQARRDPTVGEAHLLVVLEALPGASKVTTRRKLAELGIDGRRRLADLDDAEVGVVLVAFGG